MNFVLQQARHQPLTTLFIHLVQHKQGHSDRDTVANIAWLMQISGCAIGTSQTNSFGKRLCCDARRFVAHQLFATQQQQLRLALKLFAVPGL